MLELLRRIVQEVSSVETLADALRLMAERICEAIEADACSIFLRERTTDNFILMATDGLNPNLIGLLKINVDDSLVGLVAKRGEPINLDDAGEHPQFRVVPELGEERMRAFLGVPIIRQRKVLGVLTVQQEEQRRFDEAEEAFLITLATQLAGVIIQADVAIEADTHSKTGLATLHESTLIGVSGCDGIGIGQGLVVYPAADLDAVPERPAQNIGEEIELFNAALERSRQEIRQLAKRLATTLPPEEQALFDVYERILDNASLGAEVIKLIQEKNIWAQSALCQVINRHIRQFSSMEDNYLKERADDIEDLGKRVLSHLQSDEQEQQDYPDHTILIGEEITAANIAEAPQEKIVGIISGRGSRNSHVAILARALNIPTVMGVTGLKPQQLDNQEMIVNGFMGQVHVAPSATVKNEFLALLTQTRALDEELAELTDLPAQTLDGYHLALSVNTGLVADISQSLSVGAEGVGLYRTEIPFMIRERFPTEKEQSIIYQQLLAAFSPRPVIMRTLDVGGDKALPYMPIEEDNPFLGWRGIRLTLDHPEVFLVQLRAMLRANQRHRNLRILFPMITNLTEVTDALRLLHQAHQEVLEEGIDIELPPVGAMIEVPAAVYQARQLAQRVDFLSVGSNDLTQYLLAVDRNNPRVANLYDSLHPAVLRALLYIAESAHKEGKVASVCGEMAGDPVCAILLLAMGYDSLSMNSSNLPRIKWVIRKLTLARAKQLLEEVLTMDDPAIIRCHLELFLDEMGLGNLINMGRKSDLH
ncbi:MAG: phosphoenolpyruvate--protein phosphotransferase [Legionellales bacterium]|nr:phosphoenolpyruvate--protein phosphotransferase [Legionellales bacterium]